MLMQETNTMKKVLSLVLFFMSSHVFAYNCYFTAIVGHCWKNFDVTLSVLNNRTNKELASISVPKGKIWARTKIQCETNQSFLYQATFKPKIWKNNPKTLYSAKTIYHTPDTIRKKTTAWVIPICFPNDFAGVPLPPNATSMCDCSEVIHSVPPVHGEMINR